MSDSTETKMVTKSGLTNRQRIYWKTLLILFIVGMPLIPISGLVRRSGSETALKVLLPILMVYLYGFILMALVILPIYVKKRVRNEGEEEPEPEPKPETAFGRLHWLPKALIIITFPSGIGFVAYAILRQQELKEKRRNSLPEGLR